MSVGTDGAIQAPPPQAGVLGQGIAYPPSIDGKGRLKLAWGEDLVDQSLQSLCLTQPGERVMQPDYGAASETFEPVLGLARLKAKLDEQIAAHEPRAKSVEVTVDIAPDGTPIVTVSREVDTQANARTLTFPIYTPPSTTGSSL